MKNLCLKINLDEARPGMVLWESILDSKGAIMLPAGTSLTPSVMASLQRRGIDSVLVVNDAIKENELRFERERIKKRVTNLFRNCNKSSAAQSLLSSILEYRLGGSK